MNNNFKWYVWLIIVLGIILLSPHKDLCYYGSEMNTQIGEHSEVKL